MRSARWRSSAAPGTSKPQVKAVTGRAFSRAMRVAMMLESTPPERKRP